MKDDGTPCGSIIINKDTGRCRFHPNTNVGKASPKASPAAKSKPMPVAAKKLPTVPTASGICQAIRNDNTPCTNNAKYGQFCGVHKDKVSGPVAHAPVAAHAPTPRPVAAHAPTPRPVAAHAPVAPAQKSSCSGDSNFTEGEVIGKVQCLGKTSESVFCKYYSGNGIRCHRHVARFRNIQTKKEFLADHCLKIHHSTQTLKEREERMRIGQDTIVKTKLAAVAQFE